MKEIFTFSQFLSKEEQLSRLSDKFYDYLMGNVKNEKEIKKIEREVDKEIFKEEKRIR